MKPRMKPQERAAKLEQWSRRAKAHVLKPADCTCGSPIFWTTTHAGKKIAVEKRRTNIIEHQTGRMYVGYEPHVAYCPVWAAERTRQLYQKARDEHRAQIEEEKKR